MKLINKHCVLSLLLFTLIWGVSCDETFFPKPKGFNYIELPAHNYVRFSNSEDPFSFEYDSASVVIADTQFFSEHKRHYKIISYPGYDAKIHLTYKSINGSVDSLDSYVDEAYRLVYGHDVKAYGITPEVIVLPNGNEATLIMLEGDVPSQYQFFTHDSTQHFMRGALYFQSALKNDSLQPVIDFVIEDIHHFLKSLEWK